ncbi:MAG: TMEM175 family protein [Actinomycetes bacterium]
MQTGRLEAFSDGVLAIIITIMVLELKIPEGEDFAALRHDAGTGLLTYLLSFVYVGIYWNNHHHMFQLTERVTGSVLWANLHLLFWLSLLPFTTAWMDDSGFARAPVMTYGVDLLAAAVAYFVLQSLIIGSQGSSSVLRRAVGRDLKGRLSPALYIAGIVCGAFISAGSVLPALLAMGWFVTAAVVWLVPDRRIERLVSERGRQE